MPHTRSWLRGNCVIIVGNVPYHSIKRTNINKSINYNIPRPQAKIGDILDIYRHIGSGWYRARNFMTGKVITIRTGAYMANRGYPPYLSDDPKQWPQNHPKIYFDIKEKSNYSIKCESLGERRGFKPLVCEVNSAKFPVYLL